jgi:hypothetical protein
MNTRGRWGFYLIATPRCEDDDRPGHRGCTFSEVSGQIGEGSNKGAGAYAV